MTNTSKTMTTSIRAQKHNTTSIIKPLSTIVLGFAITQMALMGILFSQSAVFVGYILIFSGVFPLALKDKIILALMKWLKMYSNNIVNIINVRHIQHITIQNNFYTYNNSTSRSTSTTTINNIQYYQSDIGGDLEGKYSMLDSFLSVIKYLHDNNKIELSANVLNNLANIQYRTTHILFMKQNELTNALAYSKRLGIFIFCNKTNQNEIPFCLAECFKWKGKEIIAGSLNSAFNLSLASSETELSNSVKPNLKKLIDQLLKSN